MSIAVLYDVNRCIGCGSCQQACNNKNDSKASAWDITVARQNDVNPRQLSASSLTRLRVTDLDYNNKSFHLFTKIQCMHCQDPACATACPVGAMQKTADGPVIYDRTRCFGCRYCMVACPFGIPTYEWGDPIPWVRKCDLCADRLAEGKLPACVAACPAKALIAGERADIINVARSRIAAMPSLYQDHIYGEQEVGGTTWLYLSPVPFDKLGFPDVIKQPVTVNAERAMGFVPPALFGVATVISGLYWVIKRRDRMMRERLAEKAKKEAAE